LADILTAKPATPDALYFTPRDGLLTVSLNLNDGEKRWEKLLALIDGMTKPQPGAAERPSTSAALHEMEERVKLNIGKDIFRNLTGAAVGIEFDGAPHAADHFGSPLILQATDAEAAKSLQEEALPKLLGLASGKAPAVIREDADGRSFSVIPAAELEEYLHAKNLYIGREGAFLALGGDRKEVTAALNAGGKKAGLLSEEKTVAALKGAEDSAALVVFSPAKGIVDLFKQLEQPPTVMAAPPFVRVAPAPAPLPPIAKPAPKQADGPPPKLSLRAEKTIADAAKVVESLPPSVLNLSRNATGLTLEMRQAGLRNTASRLIDLAIDAALDRLLEQQKPNGN
jgi:hypothetical protein